ncbi:protein ANTHESIS POMOTING FACTOR 1 isoform X1 [Gastrolobium bilobum]|uniref:protein ANTHESIS POMOTING FACTOR 1 isoform X1 n=1 Tax=Gastrolobium bilobum TaxID=150636 RepID=UPI002AB31008|nr:protein ANTHESIS POMOTING FACTOR 1 isoform X1 [Gastrolobium bilobum]
MMTASLEELDDDTVRSMSIGAVFSDFGGKIYSLDFHRKDDLLVTASEDDSVRLYDIANAKLLKTTYHKKHGTDRICFTHHPSSVICSSRYNLESSGESLRYLSMYDNRYLRYFKGHKQRVVSLCMSPINDSFMSGSLDHSVRIWDLRVNACQGILRLRGRPAVAYDQQGLVFAVAMEGGAIKLFDSRSYDKGPFDTFLVGGDTAEVCDIKFSNDGKSMLLTTTNNNIYVLDAYAGEKRYGFSLEPSPGTTIEATFTPDGKYVVAGSGSGTMHAWSVEMKNEVACWSSHIGVPWCLKWAPRRAMLAAASTVLTFWIPNNDSKLKTEYGGTDAEAGAQPQPLLH